MEYNNDWYWLAGIMEGEGSFCLSTFNNLVKAKYGQYTYRYQKIVVALQMTDEDVVRRAHQIINLGTICTKHKKGRKLLYILQVQNQKDAASLMTKLKPLMGSRRQSQIEKCLTFYHNKYITKQEIQTT